MSSRVLPLTRYLIAVAVIGSFLLATTLILYAGVQTIRLVWTTIATGQVTLAGGKALLLGSIELADLYLLGTVFYIIAIGLYDLFIDDKLPMPAWLEIHDLDDLKSNLIGVVIVVLGVLFLGEVVAWDGERDLLRSGVGTALVIAALTYFLGQRRRA